MSFQYKPVALRYQTKSEVYASSGIHIFTNNDDFILTINHIPRISNYQILINEFDSDDDVYWHVGVLEREIVTDGIKFGDVSGFDLFPADSFSRHREGISLLMIKLKDKKVERKGLEEFRVGDNRNVKEVKILSYPFNLTNSLIFKDFVSQGYITNRVRPGWYLSDIRYVENMNGGVVLNAENGNVVGLVYGNLRKRNGDGDLLVIIDIHVILKQINISSNPQLQITPPPTPEPQQNDNNLQTQTKSVIPLVVSDAKGNTTWGTSILYTPSILITNNHVIQPYLSHGTCQLVLNKTYHALTNKDNVIIPITDLDLAFIFLHDEIDIDGESSISLGRSTVNKPGDTVYSISYGLVLDYAFDGPMISKGVINCIYKLPLQKTFMKNKINALIIASSSCWNGSSGGGIFNDQGEFIGLICSNAQVKAPVVYDEKEEKGDEKIEKNSSFSFILPVEIIEYCYYMILSNQDISQVNHDQLCSLWKLEPFHNDILMHSEKL